MRTRLVIGAFLVLALAPLARADGLPVTGAQLGGPPILRGPNVNGRIVALPVHGGTVVARFGNVVYTSRFIRGRFAIPQVAQDGTAAGLSHGATALVLISPRRTFPRARTTLGVAQAALKWPNDLLVGGAKLGGILVETRGRLAVFGFGINCRRDGALELRLRRPIASLDQFIPPDRSRVIELESRGEQIAALTVEP